MTDVVDSQREAAARLENSVVTIGNFDGMHIGHQSIFQTAVDEAARRQATPVALTFEPHPEAFFRPDEAPIRLSPPMHKFELMESYGAELVVALAFDESLSGQSPEEFVRKILVDSLKAEHVVVGKDFRFGKKRAGDTDSLEKLGKPLGMSTTVAEFIEWDGEPVSSTRARRAVAAGDMKSVNAMLARPYRLFGKVVRGEQRGRKLGFPTANLKPVDMALPPTGVYATTLARRQQGHWSAITNIGTRPTFEGTNLTIETFVLDDDVDEELHLYDEEVELDVYRRVREERNFESPDKLVAQIQRDVDEVRAFFKREGIDGRR